MQTTQKSDTHFSSNNMSRTGDTLSSPACVRTLPSPSSPFYESEAEALHRKTLSLFQQLSKLHSSGGGGVSASGNGTPFAPPTDTRSQSEWWEQHVRFSVDQFNDISSRHLLVCRLLSAAAGSVEKVWSVATMLDLWKRETSGTARPTSAMWYRGFDRCSSSALGFPLCSRSMDSMASNADTSVAFLPGNVLRLALELSSTFARSAAARASYPLSFCKKLDDHSLDVFTHEHAPSSPQRPSPHSMSPTHSQCWLSVLLDMTQSRSWQVLFSALRMLRIELSEQDTITFARYLIAAMQNDPREVVQIMKCGLLLESDEPFLACLRAAVHRLSNTSSMSVAIESIDTEVAVLVVTSGGFSAFVHCVEQCRGFAGMPQPSIPDSSPWSLTKTVENNAGLTHGVVDEYTQRDLALTVVDRVLTLACHAANPIGCAGRGSGSGVSFPLVRLLPLHIARRDESTADYSSLRSSTGTLAKGLAGGAVLSVVSLLAASLVCMGRPLDGGKLLCIASGTHPALCTADGALSILQSTLDCGTAPLREGSNLRAGRSSGSSRACSFEWEQLLSVSLGLLRPNGREHKAAEK